MHEDDAQHRMDDDGLDRTQDAETNPPQTPVIRLLANPRRVRRA